MLEFAAKSLALPLTMVSDGLGCFTAICAVHDRTVSGDGRSCVKLPQFRAVNTVLGNLKAALSGTYHAFDFGKYAHRYLAEVQYCFNRRFDLSSILVRLVRADVITKPRPMVSSARLRQVANQVRMRSRMMLMLRVVNVTTANGRNSTVR